MNNLHVTNMAKSLKYIELKTMWYNFFMELKAYKAVCSLELSN